MKISHLSKYYDQGKLKTLCQIALQDIDGLIECLELDSALKDNGRMFVGPCPVHGGDRFNAFNLYYSDEDGVGRWVCHTKHCEKHFVNTLVGFVRGVLSHTKYNWQVPGDQEDSFHKAVSFVLNFTKKEFGELEVQVENLEKKRFVRQVAQFYKEPDDIPNRITRPDIRKQLEIPAKYYINRGYNSSILDTYDIGYCSNKYDFMYDRVVVPLYDESYNYVIGCSGRSIWEKCWQCNTYHNPENPCPQGIDKGKFSKWQHSPGFKAHLCLYNYWRARKHILKSMVAILVESPGNVWRLEEAGIHNSVAMLGDYLNNEQRMILDGSGALSIIGLMDNDGGGEIARKSIIEKCQRTYRLYFPGIKSDKNDVGDMSSDEITEDIAPIINTVKNAWRGY